MACWCEDLERSDWKAVREKLAIPPELEINFCCVCGRDLRPESCICEDDLSENDRNWWIFCPKCGKPLKEEP